MLKIATCLIPFALGISCNETNDDNNATDNKVVQSDQAVDDATDKNLSEDYDSEQEIVLEGNWFRDVEGADCKVIDNNSEKIHLEVANYNYIYTVINYLDDKTCANPSIRYTGTGT